MAKQVIRVSFKGAFCFVISRYHPDIFGPKNYSNSFLSLTHLTVIKAVLLLIFSLVLVIWKALSSLLTKGRWLLWLIISIVISHSVSLSMDQSSTVISSCPHNPQNYLMEAVSFHWLVGISNKPDSKQDLELN